MLCPNRKICISKLDIRNWKHEYCMTMVPPVWEWIRSSPVQSSPRNFWTGTRLIPGADILDWAWSGPIPHGVQSYGILSWLLGSEMEEIYLNTAEYTNRSGIISTKVGIWRWVVIQIEDEYCYWWYLAKKQCQIYMRKWIGPDQARPVQDSQSVVRSSPTIPLDRTGLIPHWTVIVWTGGIIAVCHSCLIIFDLNI